jgi:hypothetical protein
MVPRGGLEAPTRGFSVPEHLAGHPGEPRGFLVRQVVEGVGEREQAGDDPAVVLAAGEAAQLGRVAAEAD